MFKFKALLMSIFISVTPMASAFTQVQPEILATFNFEEEHQKNVNCLALNVYHEARNESLAGQIAVAQVVMNRVKHHNYPNTVCGVIHEGPTYTNANGNIVPRRHKCQFSWYCDGLSDKAKNTHAWRESVSIANAVLDDIYPDIVEGALWYHADYVFPKWRNGVRYVTQIDRHIFYTELNK